jgi:hypothetical protein
LICLKCAFLFSTFLAFTLWSNIKSSNSFILNH